MISNIIFQLKEMGLLKEMLGHRIHIVSMEHLIIPESQEVFKQQKRWRHIKEKRDSI